MPQSKIEKLEKQRKAALYEAHQELHQLKTPSLEALVSDWDQKTSVEKLGAVFKGFGDTELCLTDHPKIRVDAARRILAQRKNG